MRPGNRALRAALAGLLLLAGSAPADSITFTMSNVFSGTGSPSGAPVVTIDDQGTPGDVRFVFDATGLASSTEKISRWYFNTGIDLSSGGVFSAFTNVTGFVSGITLHRAFDTTAAGFKADGDGYFDWVFSFPTSGAGAFGDNDKFGFLFGYPGITAATFGGWSLPSGGGSGPFRSALHIQGIGTTGANSVWLSPGDGGTTVPEPGLVLLALLGLAGAARARRRRP